MEASRYTSSDAILYPDVLLITLLSIMSSDDEMDGYKSNGNIFDVNKVKGTTFLLEFVFAFYGGYRLQAMTAKKTSFFRQLW